MLSKLSKVVCCLKYGVKINDDVERKFFSGERSAEKWVRCKHCFFLSVALCTLAQCLKIIEKISFIIIGIGQKLVENSEMGKFKCDILGDF